MALSPPSPLRHGAYPARTSGRLPRFSSEARRSTASTARSATARTRAAATAVAPTSCDRSSCSAIRKGELIGDVVRNGRPATGMPPIALTPPQISDIADFIHSFSVGGDDAARNVPVTIVVGNATSGAAAFQTRCAGCHSTTGDLKGIGARFADRARASGLLAHAGGGTAGAEPGPAPT